MESYAKYADMPRAATQLLMDEPAIVVLGRTFEELVSTVVVFVGLAYFGMVWTALAVAVVIGGVLPLYRIRYERGHIQHVAWSFGLWFPEVAMFTPRRGTKVMGP